MKKVHKKLALNQNFVGKGGVSLDTNSVTVSSDGGVRRARV